MPLSPGSSCGEQTDRRFRGPTQHHPRARSPTSASLIPQLSFELQLSGLGHLFQGRRQRKGSAAIEIRANGDQSRAPGTVQDAAPGGPRCCRRTERGRGVSNSGSATRNSPGAPVPAVLRLPGSLLVVLGGRAAPQKKPHTLCFGFIDFSGCSSKLGALSSE